MAKRVTIVSRFPGNTAAFSGFTRNVITRLTGSTLYQNPPVSVAALTTLADNFDTAAGKKGPGAVTARKAARSKVESAHRKNEAYCQGIIEELPPDEQEAAVVSSGYPQRKPSTHAKQAFTVTKGKLPASALINVKALGRHGTIQYCHSYSLDGGKTWIDFPPTIETACTIPNLPMAVEVWFRFRTLIKGAYGEWSQNVTYLVH